MFSRHCYVIREMDVLIRNTTFKSKFEQMFSLSSFIIVTITLVRLKRLKILKMSIPPLELELPSDGGQPAASAPLSSTRTSSRGETRWRWPFVLFPTIILYIQRFYAGFHKQNTISFSIIN